MSNAATIRAAYPGSRIDRPSLNLYAERLAKHDPDIQAAIVTEVLSANPNFPPTAPQIEVAASRVYADRATAPIGNALPERADDSLPSRRDVAAALAARAARAEYRRYEREGGGPPRSKDEIGAYIDQCVEAGLAEFDTGKERMTWDEVNRLVDLAAQTFGGVV